MEYKKILVISQNSFNECSNNGKTILSFFEGYPMDHMAQLYFYDDYPNSSHFDTYFRVTDKDIIRNILRLNKDCGSVVHNRAQEDLPFREKRWTKSPFVRLVRECIWETWWNKEKLDKWIAWYQPDVVFAVCGDGIFTYRLIRRVLRISGAKLATYITDDYILPRKNLNLFWQMKRLAIKNEMKKNLKLSDHFYTISEQMSKKYLEIFGKTSEILMNMTHMEKRGVKKTDDDLRVVYAGGLEYNRDKSLRILCGLINEFNKVYKRKVVFEIYTISPVTESLKSIFNSGYCRYGGRLDKDELTNVLNAADILVHVESFNSRNICDTRLSISTKIYEYLSLGKPILAVGPIQVASLQFLSGTACCITDMDAAMPKLIRLFCDNIYIRSLANKTEVLLKINQQDKSKLWKKLNS